MSLRLEKCGQMAKRRKVVRTEGMVLPRDHIVDSEGSKYLRNPQANVARTEAPAKYMQRVMLRSKLNGKNTYALLITIYPAGIRWPKEEMEVMVIKMRKLVIMQGGFHSKFRDCTLSEKKDTVTSEHQSHD